MTEARRWLFGAAIALAVAALVLGIGAMAASTGTFAYFSDRVDTSARFTTGAWDVADLAVNKVAGPAPFLLGSPLTYTLTVLNHGPNQASGVVLTDTLPAGVTFGSASSSQGSCATLGGVVSCSLGALPSSAVATATVVVTPNALGTIVNSATVTSAAVDTDPANNATASSLTVVPSADLSITNPDTPDPVFAGSILTYHVTVRNTGPSVASNAVLSDSVPMYATFRSLSAPSEWTCATPPVGGTGNVTCTAPSLALMAIRSFTMTVLIDAASPSGAFIAHWASVASDTADPNLLNNSAIATTAVGAANLYVTMADSPDPIGGGAVLTYTFGVTNFGPSSATNTVLSSTVPLSTTFRTLSAPAGWTCVNPPVGGTGNVTCTVPSLASTASRQFTMTVLVNAGTPGGASITRQANVSSDTVDPNPSNNSASARTAVLGANLYMAITDYPDPIGGGAILTYTLTATNFGPMVASNVALTGSVPANTRFQSLTMPSGWTCSTPPFGGTGNVLCTVPSLASMASQVLTMTVLVNAGTPAGSMTNTATVSSDTADPNPVNNTTTVWTNVATANLYVTLTDTPDPVGGGSILTYTVNLTTFGSVPASGVVLTDTVPAGTTFQSLNAPSGWACSQPPMGGTGNVICTTPSLAPLASRVFTMTVLVNAGTPRGTLITNQASASSNTADANPSNNTATLTTTVGAANLYVAMSDSPDPVGRGGVLTYTVTLTNFGPLTAASAVLTDTVPAGTTFQSVTAPSGWTCAQPPVGGTGNVVCTVPNLAYPSSLTFIMTVLVNAGTPVGTSLANTASASSNTSDPNPSNNTATARTYVVASTP